MTRPRSILLFERLFLASLLTWCIVQAMTWADRLRLLASNPALSDPASAMAVVVLVVVGVTVAVWYFAACRSSVVAKWAAVAMAAGSALALVFGVVAVMRGDATGVAVKLLSLGTSALTIAAAVMLFRPDTRAWFGEDPSNGDDAV